MTKVTKEGKAVNDAIAYLDWGIMGMNILILLLIWSNLVALCIAGCAITPGSNGNVTIPDDWTSIGDYAFSILQCFAVRDYT